MVRVTNKQKPLGAVRKSKPIPQCEEDSSDDEPIFDSENEKSTVPSEDEEPSPVQSLAAGRKKRATAAKPPTPDETPNKRIPASSKAQQPPAKKARNSEVSASSSKSKSSSSSSSSSGSSSSTTANTSTSSRRESLRPPKEDDEFDLNMTPLSQIMEKLGASVPTMQVGVGGSRKEGFYIEERVNFPMLAIGEASAEALLKCKAMSSYHKIRKIRQLFVTISGHDICIDFHVTLLHVLMLHLMAKDMLSAQNVYSRAVKYISHPGYFDPRRGKDECVITADITKLIISSPPIYNYLSKANDNFRTFMREKAEGLIISLFALVGAPHLATEGSTRPTDDDNLIFLRSASHVSTYR